MFITNEQFIKFQTISLTSLSQMLIFICNNSFSFINIKLKFPVYFTVLTGRGKSLSMQVSENSFYETLLLSSHQNKKVTLPIA